MHIPENYLNPATCTAMFAAMFPVWKLSIDRVKVEVKKRPATIPMIGIGAAFSFLIMMFNFPLPGGTTAHAVGGGLLAFLIGPYAACLSVSLALFLQAFLFGDGGILALGANTFNMAFLMPFVSYGIYLLFAKRKHDYLGSALGSYLGIIAAAFGVSLELGLQPFLSHTASGVPNYFPYGVQITVPVMVGSHLIVGIVEAIITVCVYSFIKKSAQNTIYYFSQQQATKVVNSGYGKITKILLTILGLMTFLTPLGLIASGSAWGEWSDSELLKMLQMQHISQTLPKGMSHGFQYNAIFSGYQMKALPDYITYLLIALTVFALALLIVKVCSHDK